MTSDKFDQFWSINQKLMEITDGECFKSIPFRIYQVSQDAHLVESMSCRILQNIFSLIKNDKAFIQKLFEPLDENGKKKTLSDLFEAIFGQDFQTGKASCTSG